MSPSSSGLASGIPWQIVSLIDLRNDSQPLSTTKTSGGGAHVHTLRGNMLYPSGLGYALRCMHSWCTSLSSSSVVIPGRSAAAAMSRTSRAR